MKFLAPGNVFTVEDESTVIFEGKKLKTSRIETLDGDFGITGEYVYSYSYPNMPLFTYKNEKGETIAPKEIWTIVARKKYDPEKKIRFRQYEQ